MAALEFASLPPHFCLAELAAEPFFLQHSFDLAVDSDLLQEAAEPSFLQQGFAEVTATLATSIETGLCVLEACCAWEDNAKPAMNNPKRHIFFMVFVFTKQI